MKLSITKDLKHICLEIIQADKTQEEWCAIESDDMFQAGTLCGGFNGEEKDFCFEVIIDGVEYWFQLSLEQVALIAEGRDISIDAREAE